MTRDGKKIYSGSKKCLTDQANADILCSVKTNDSNNLVVKNTLDRAADLQISNDCTASFVPHKSAAVSGFFSAQAEGACTVKTNEKEKAKRQEVEAVLLGISAGQKVADEIYESLKKKCIASLTFVKILGGASIFNGEESWYSGGADRLLKELLSDKHPCDAARLRSMLIVANVDGECSPLSDEDFKLADKHLKDFLAEQDADITRGLRAYLAALLREANGEWKEIFEQVKNEEEVKAAAEPVGV